MADITKTVSVLFQGTDDVSDILKGMRRNIDSFGDDIGDIGAPFADITKGVLAVDAALVALAAGGLLYAFNASKTYEQAVLELQKVMGDGEEITEELSQSFTDLSREYGVATTDIVGSLAELRQSGFDTNEGLILLETGLKLARASELDTAEATNLLKRAIIGYKLEVKDATDLGDLFNRTSNVSSTSVGKLAEGFAIVARQAKDAGFSLAQTVAVITPIIGVFDSGSEAGVAFSASLSRILDPAKEGEAAIRFLTGATGPLNEEFKTGRELFEAIAIGLQKVDDQTGAVAVSQIVGVQQAKRIKVAFDDYFDTLDKIGPPSARYLSLQKEVDLQNASSTASVDRLKAGFSNLSVTIGNQFRNAAQEAIDGGTAIENALEDIIKAGTFKDVFSHLEFFAREIGTALDVIAKNLPEAFEEIDFSGLLDAFGDVGDSLKGVFDGIDLTTPEGLQEAIQAIIDTLESLVRTSSGIAQSLTLISDAVAIMITAFNSLDSGSKKLIGNMLGMGTALVTLGGVLKIGGLLLGGISSAIGLFTSLGAVFASGGVLATGIALLSGPVGLSVVGAILGGFAINKVIDQFRDLGDEVTGAGEAIKTIPESIAFKIDADTEGFDDYIDAIEDVPDEVSVAITTAINEGDFDKVNAILAGITDEKQITVTADVTQATETLTFWTETEGEITIEVPVSAEGVEQVKKDIEEIPTEKQIEIKLKGEIDTEIARITATAETAQAAFEYTAQVDIAQIQAAAQMSVAAFDAIGESVVALAGSTADMFGSLVGQWDNLSQFDQNVLMRNVDQQQDAQNKALESQITLNEAQAEYLTARTEAAREGEAVITIDSSGLEPSLEMIMFQIIEKVQIRATENASEFLLGV